MLIFGFTLHVINLNSPKAAASICLCPPHPLLSDPPSLTFSHYLFPHRCAAAPSITPNSPALVVDKLACVCAAGIPTSSSECILSICLNFSHLKASEGPLQQVPSPEWPFWLLSPPLAAKASSLISLCPNRCAELVKYLNTEIGVRRGSGH